MQTKNTIGTRTNTYTDERRKSSAGVVTPRNEQTEMMIVLCSAGSPVPAFYTKVPIKIEGTYDGLPSAYNVEWRFFGLELSLT
jgi:hypothetical protein